MKCTIKYPVITGIIVNIQCWEIGHIPIHSGSDIFSFIKTISDEGSIYRTILEGRPPAPLITINLLYCQDKGGSQIIKMEI